MTEDTFNNTHISNASFWARLAAWIIDILIISIVFYGLLFTFYNSGGGGDFLGLSLILMYFVFLAWYFGYYESNGRQTFGKKVLNIQTIQQDGSNLSFLRASIRGYLKLFFCGPNLFALVNVIYMAINNEDLMIQDWIAKTRVVYTIGKEKP